MRSLILLFSIIVFQPMDAISQSFMGDWKWKVGFNNTFSKSYRTTGTDSYQKEYVISEYSPDTIGYRERAEHEIYVNNFGIDLERKLNRYFSLKTGLYINSYGKQGYYTYHSFVYNSSGNRYKSKYSYISIPLNLYLNYLQNKHFRAFVSLGIEMNYLKFLKEWKYSWNTDAYNHGYPYLNKGLYMIHRYSYDDLRKVNYTFNFSTGIDVKLYKSGFLRFEPTFNLLLKSVGGVDKNDIKFEKENETYYKIGMNLSLNFILKSKKNKTPKNGDGKIDGNDLQNGLKTIELD